MQAIYYNSGWTPWRLFEDTLRSSGFIKAISIPTNRNREQEETSAYVLSSGIMVAARSIWNIWPYGVDKKKPAEQRRLHRLCTAGIISVHAELEYSPVLEKMLDSQHIYPEECDGIAIVDCPLRGGLLGMVAMLQSLSPIVPWRRQQEHFFFIFGSRDSLNVFDYRAREADYALRQMSIEAKTILGYEKLQTPMFIR
jgi:hypothetical protein